MRLALLLSFAVVSCGGTETKVSPAEPEAEQWVELETGEGCAGAEVACAPGNCAARVSNQCKRPVTCDLSIECICRTYTGHEGPAKGTSGENTILSGDEQGLAAHVLCDQGEVIATIARDIRCF